MTEPKVSIVLLCFDRPEMLRPALDSLAAQSYPHLEIIVVNNRSSRSEEIAEIVAAYPQFAYLPVPFNSGFTGGMNRGLASATGEYVYFTEEDIVLAPDCIQVLVAALESEPSISLACPLMIDEQSGRIRSAGGWFQLDPVYRQGDYGAGDDPDSFVHSRNVTYIAGNMVFARAALLRDIGAFRDDIFIYYDDIDLCARTLRAGKRIAVVPSARIWNLDPPSHRPAPALLEFHKIKNLYMIYLLHAAASCLPEFFARYGVLSWIRSPFSRNGRLRAKAIAWIAVHLLRLLRDRKKMPGIEPGALRRQLRESAR
jgi:GT2 family glycosyltransferase